jgi:glycosyltransferase involved in cell wall biosynthesis
VLRAAAWSSGHVPNATIGVSRDLARHYANRWGRAIDYIPNGVNAMERRQPDEIARRWNLGEGDYVLYVGRLVPEKAPDRLLRAFRTIPGDVRLVIAGGSSFSDEYRAQLVALADADERILLTGNVYGEELAELYSNARVFVLPSDLEGLPLTLLEAASYGTPVVTSDIPPHLEVLGDSGPGHRIFPAGDEAALAKALSDALADPAAERNGATKLRDKVLREYRWDDAVDATEQVYQRVLTKRRRRS